MTSGEDSSTPSSLTSSIPNTPQTNATSTPNYQLPRRNDNTTPLNHNTPLTPTPTITNQRIAQLRQQIVDVQKALISTQANILAKANSIKHSLYVAATASTTTPTASGAAPTIFSASNATTVKTTHQHHFHPQNYSNVQPTVNQQQYYNNNPNHFGSLLFNNNANTPGNTNQNHRYNLQQKQQPPSSFFGNDGGNESEIKRGDESNSNSKATAPNIATALISNALASNNKSLANNNFVDGELIRPRPILLPLLANIPRITRSFIKDFHSKDC
ncbi:14366_t:CDS:2 [Ambispora leptoticha]|uniref:14366_t:CDS:1 n=1 Tax=Ambispora leptoticha TaxID=144679 RepID=A0A9N8YXX4_9GLOM|nr:14366_t:CDS:2 [Ambispora leptoticha]